MIDEFWCEYYEPSEEIFDEGPDEGPDEMFHFIKIMKKSNLDPSLTRWQGFTIDHLTVGEVCDFIEKCLPGKSKSSGMP